ncbi:MAG TPA: hypothetical protein VGG41_04555 [Solirubrobacteraceae bacterium]|jgi:hypothetical protein
MRRWLAVPAIAVSLAVGLAAAAPWSATADPTTAPAITAQPDMALVAGAGQGTEFSANASGTPAPTVQWQVARDRNGPWANVTGNDSENATTLVLEASAANLGDAYRAVFTNSAGTAISRPAKLISRADWMGEMGNDIADVPLSQLTIPGTHDMGTYGIGQSSNVSLDGQLPAVACDVSQSVCVSYARAQDPSNTAAEELTDGIRYFDLRVCGSPPANELDIPADWPDFSLTTCHGLEGAPLPTILSDVRAFALAHPKEVVVLDFNHEFQADLDNLASAITQAFAIPGGSLMIPPQYCVAGDIDSGECASQLTLSKIWTQHLGNVIVNLENDGAPGSSQTTEVNFSPAQYQTFDIQPVPSYAFYDRWPLLWGRLDGAPNSMEFCTESSATTSCFGNNADVQSVRSRVMNTIDTRTTFSDTNRFFIQFLQTTPNTDFIIDNLDRSLLDMAVSPDIGANPIVGPDLFDCGFGADTCFAADRPENVNIVAINFYDRTDYDVDHAMSLVEVEGCVLNNGACDLSAQEVPTISCTITLDCVYTDPVHFDFVDAVLRFDEYARTAPVVSATPALGPASTGWYNAATLGGQGKTLTVNVKASDYYYPVGVTALSCLDDAAALAIAPNTPSPTPLAHGSATLGDGVHQLGCLATDGANQGFNHQGNSGDGPGSQASPLIRIDTHPPTVTYAGNGGSYGILAPVAIMCTATDSLSGIASSTCPGASGAGWSFGAGQHTLTATATDNAGNSAGATTSFTITVSPADLATLTRQFVQGSAKYKASSFFAQAIVGVIVGADAALLTPIGPRTSPVQKTSLLTLYRSGVKSLVQSGWLTTAQGSVLTSLTAAI